jgi:hypothetical protein
MLHSANIVAFHRNILTTQPGIYVSADIYRSSQHQQMHTSKLKQKNCACVGAVRKCAQNEQYAVRRRPGKTAAPNDLFCIGQEPLNVL